MCVIALPLLESPRVSSFNLFCALQSLKKKLFSKISFTPPPPPPWCWVLHCYVRIREMSVNRSLTVCVVENIVQSFASEVESGIVDEFDKYGKLL